MRWNSTYLMLESALHFRLAFEQLKNVDGDFIHCPSEYEWEKVRNIVRFLKPFYNITKLFSRSEYPTSNLYFHGVWRIEELLCIELNSLDEDMTEAALEMKEKFDKYWEDYSLVLCFALILDPRFKLVYVKYSFRKIHTETITQEKVNIILDRFKNLFDDYLRRSSRSIFCSPRASMFGSSDDVDDEIDDFSRFESEQNDSTRSQSELDMYLASPRLQATQELDVLKYWRENSDRYPTLASMAKDILAIPITTVASESTFSIGGRVIGKFRSTLSLDTTESLVCTRDWLFGVEAQKAIEDEHVVDFAPLVAQLDASATV